MSILGITISLVSAAFLSFERRERVKTAAFDLKSNLRLAQNKALAGDKGLPNGSNCSTSQTLVGWYMSFDSTTPNQYEIWLSCQNNPGMEDAFLFNTIILPDEVNIVELRYHGKNAIIDATPLWTFNHIILVLFQPIGRDVYSYYGSADSGPSFAPPFYNSSGDINYATLVPLLPGNQEWMKVVLDGFGNQYEVFITAEGDIYEKKL